MSTAVGFEPLSFMGQRYANAYVVAKSTVAMGRWVKVLSLVLLVAGVGLIFAIDSGPATAPMLISVLCAAFFCFVMGLLLAALGEIMRCLLDTAVNTSPCATDVEKAAIMNTTM